MVEAAVSAPRRDWDTPAPPVEPSNRSDTLVPPSHGRGSCEHPPGEVETPQRPPGMVQTSRCSLEEVEAETPPSPETPAETPPCSRHVPWTVHIPLSPTDIPQLDGAAPDPPSDIPQLDGAAPDPPT